MNTSTRGDPKIKKQVRLYVMDRAKEMCEYCKYPLASLDERFCLDHVVPGHAGGKSDINNLALSCQTCNSAKRTKMNGVDPHKGKEVRLFNPRKDKWEKHFEWDGIMIRGRTAVGRATVAALDLNSVRHLVRRFFRALGDLLDSGRIGLMHRCA